MRDRRRRRRWEVQAEDDPLTGLVNLFDLWMVFSIALLIVFAGSVHRRGASPTAPAHSRVADASPSVPLQQAQAIERYRVSREELAGSGEKLGTAYRLASGEVVCVPDAGEKE
jgi:hypothetical protein